MSDELQKLIEAAKTVEMTPVQLEEQRRSFAFGNANIENQRVTRETVAKAAELLSRGKVTKGDQASSATANLRRT